jgi:DNA-binding NtrC family response regulator
LAAILADEDFIQPGDLNLQATEGKRFLSESSMTIHEITMYLIHQKLEKTGNNFQLVADELGLGKSTIYRLLKEEKETNINSN